MQAVRAAAARRQINTLSVVAKQELENIKAAGTYKAERVITTPQAGHIKVSTSEKDVLNFCANNYIGLADNAEVSSCRAAVPPSVRASAHCHRTVARCV